jgi:hypothetical protein
MIDPDWRRFVDHERAGGGHRRHATDIHRKPLVFVLSLARSLLVRNLSAMCARFVERKTDNGSLAMFSKS